MGMSEESRKTKSMFLRLDPSVADTLRKRAKHARLTLAEYVAFLVKGSK